MLTISVEVVLNVDKLAEKFAILEDPEKATWASICNKLIKDAKLQYVYFLLMGAMHKLHGNRPILRTQMVAIAKEMKQLQVDPKELIPDVRKSMTDAKKEKFIPPK